LDITANYTSTAGKYRVSILHHIPYGAGTHTLDPPGGLYDPGTQVTMTPIPIEGCTFSDWYDGHWILIYENPATVTVDSDIEFRVYYDDCNAHKISVATDPIYKGRIEMTPYSFPYGDGIIKYIHGTEVSLLAIPDDGYTFLNWSGDISGSENPITVVMDSDKNITANLESPPTMNAYFSGTISRNVDLISPHLVLKRTTGTLLKDWELTGGSTSATFNKTYEFLSYTNFYIWATDDLDNDGVLFEGDEPSVCYDEDDDEECDWLVMYQDGASFSNLDVVLPDAEIGPEPLNNIEQMLVYDMTFSHYHYYEFDTYWEYKSFMPDRTACYWRQRCEIGCEKYNRTDYTSWHIDPTPIEPGTQLYRILHEPPTGLPGDYIYDLEHAVIYNDPDYQYHESTFKYLCDE
jgi:hypothetical protein